MLNMVSSRHSCNFADITPFWQFFLQISFVTYRVPGEYLAHPLPSVDTSLFQVALVSPPVVVLQIRPRKWGVRFL